MSDQSHIVARLLFKGQRYSGHVLDPAALEEILQFQRVVAETAKDVWRSAHPKRKRLPVNFEDRTQLCFRAVGGGSTTVNLELLHKPQQLGLWNNLDYATKAAILVHEAVEATSKRAPLPAVFPKRMLSELAKLGDRLASGTELQIAAGDASLIPITGRIRRWLRASADDSHEDTVEVIGRVLEVDVRQQRFQIWPDEGSSVTVEFTAEQEDMVTTGLKEHASMLLKVTVSGILGPDGELRRTQTLRGLEVLKGEESRPTASAQEIADLIASLVRDVPDHEWERLPIDLSHRHDYYLYGIDRP